MKKFVMFCNKRNHFKVCCPRLAKKVHEIEKDESAKHSNQSNYEFFIETVSIQDSAYIDQIKNENSDWPSIALPSNGIPVSYKIDTGAQCNVIPLTILKNFDPEPNLCPVNIIIKLSTYNNSKILVLGECSLTLKHNHKHKKDHFDDSFVVVDSKPIPCLS